MNPSTVVQLFFLATAVIFGIAINYATHRRLKIYWQRACTGRQWKRRFPNASKSQIRAFLELFVNAFAFSSKRRLCFSPDDRVTDIYRTLYPPDWNLADALELEMLAEDIQKTYGTDIIPLWRDDISIGDLFAQTRNTAQR